MRVLTIDDHPMYRDGLRALLAALWPDAEVLEAAELDAGLRLLESAGDVDLVLLDMMLPGSGILDGLDILRDRYPLAPVGGASAFLSKSAAAPVLSRALARVLEGEIVVIADGHAPSATAVEPEAEQSDRRTARDGATLTDRQQVVLGHLERGLTNKEIARALGISPATVRAHVSALLAALGATNRTEAIRLARDSGLLR
jgi:DNA-binding NarL/FixJ family response regulator